MLSRAAIGSLPKLRRSACSVVQQVRQLHDGRLQLHNKPRGFWLAPDHTIGGSCDQKLAALTSYISDEELTLLKKKNPAPVCYAWCDPTPWMHITQGISMTLNVNKLIKAGCKVKILMADWFARTDPDITRELAHSGGDLSQVMRDICSYNVETWRVAGMDLDGVELVHLSDEITGRGSDAYWQLATDVASISDLGGMQRWLRVHASEDPRIAPNGYGSDSDDPEDTDMMGDFRAMDVFHPCLQCAAMLLFQEKADMWLLGLDQRVAGTLARQCRERVMGTDEEDRCSRPVALFHDTPRNLRKYPGSESFDARWAIFMEDNEDDLVRKMWDAFCPPESVHKNACLDYVKYIVLPWFGKFEVVRKKKDGGNKTFWSMEELTADYESGALQPADVRQGLVKAVDMMLRPFRDHFKSSPQGKEIARAMERFYVIGWSPGHSLLH